MGAGGRSVTFLEKFFGNGEEPLSGQNENSVDSNIEVTRQMPLHCAEFSICARQSHGIPDDRIFRDRKQRERY